MNDGPETNPCEPVILPGTTPERITAEISAGQARLLALTASLMWSTSGFFVKAPFFTGWPGPVIAFWRAVFACLILWPLVRHARWSWRLVPMTLLFAGMNYTYLTAMVTGTAANAIWLQCTAPVWVLLLGALAFGERAIGRDWLMVAFAMLGVGVIIYHESQGVALNAVGWGLTSGVMYAGVVLSLRDLRGFDAVWLAALNHLVTAVALLPIAIADARLPAGTQWIFLAGLGIIQMAIPYVLFAHSLKRIAGHEAAGIGLVEPLLVPAWAYLAWGDRPAWWTFVGGGFILAGLTLRYIVPARSARSRRNG